MVILLQLAARNILRTKARSALTFGAIFLGVLLSILLSGFGNGFSMLMRNDIVYSKVGAIQVHRRGYADVRDSQPLDLDMEEGGALVARIRAVPGVRAVTPRLVFSGLINNGADATTYIARGIDPVAEYEVLTWAKTDVAGKPLDRQRPAAGIMGSELAAALGLALGDTAILQAASKGGQQNALDLEIVGTLDNANAFEAKRFLHVPLAFAQGLLRMPGRVTEYAIGVDDLERLEPVAAALRAAVGPDYEVETWTQLQPNVADVIRFQGVVVGLIGGVFLIIVIFGVVNSMVMSVLERTREIGTMMALGVTRGTISGLFVCEAALLALVGGLSGAAMARGTEGLIGVLGGIPVSPPGITVERFRLVPHAPSNMLLAALGAAVLGALAAAAYPAWKAARLRPVEALRAV
jgi:putative ABC transport system permease protein